MKPHVAVFTSLVLSLLASCASAPLDVNAPGSTPVFYRLEFTINDGQQAAVRALMEEMVAAAKNEAGTLVYAWYISDDGSSCHVYERFADTAAYQVHGANFATTFAERFLASIKITGLVVYGNADEMARNLLVTMRPVYMDAYGGFRR